MKYLQPSSNRCPSVNFMPASPFKNTTVQLTVGAIIIVAAAILGLSRYRLPAKNVHLPLLSSNTNAPMTYPFTGKVSTADITGKQVHITTPKGDIVFTLDAAQAPIAASSFFYLANQGYFNGLKWHRVVDGFVIQGGDPTGTGSGGPGYTFADEPVSGEYTAGTVAMANAGADTNGSQFFIVLADQPTLPKSYTIFGRVTTGMDVVKKIVQGDTMDKVTVEPAQ